MTEAQITKYIFLEDQDLEGDIALVFGTWNNWKESVDKAVSLYKNILVPKIILSGGLNEKTKIIEGDVMAEEAIRLGIPAKDVLVENKSTNTLENVLFSIRVIDEVIGLKNIKVIVAVVKNYHARRALMTLKKHLPENIKLKSAVYHSDYYGFTKDNWHKSDIGSEKVFEELQKIKTYLAKGDLAEL